MSLCYTHRLINTKDYQTNCKFILPLGKNNIILLIVGGGSNPIFAHGKMCVFPYFPMGKMGKKVYGKKGKNIHFPLFPYTFFPMEKNGKTHIFPWAKMGLDPPPPNSFKQISGQITKCHRSYKGVTRSLIKMHQTL